MFKITHKGSFNNFEQFCNRILRRDYLNILSEYADRGLEALRNATPVDTGETAASWNYEIEIGYGKTTIYYTNSAENNGVNIVILLLYGHGTRDGGYVEGVDFISPALEPVFRDLADAMWEEVTK